MKKENPKVSIITPTYNRANYLQKSIESVMNQTFKNFEYIIVDDGSSDDTREVVRFFSESDERVKYLFQKNSGVNVALNNGLSKASGNYIAILEDDDIWRNDKLEKQVEILDSMKEVGLVSCWANIMKEGKKLGIFKTYKHVISKTHWCEFWIKFGIISTSTVLFRRELIDNIGYFDTKLKSWGDADFYMRAIQNCDFYVIPEALIDYNLTENSLSRSYFWKKWIPDIEHILNKHADSFTICKKAKSKVLKTLGTCLILDERHLEGVSNLLRSYICDPLNFSLILQAILGIISPKLYKKILFIKRKRCGYS